MQTFLPYASFEDSAKSLDMRRLGKQRVEVKQILIALTEGRGWVNHPATKMWRGYESALAEYGVAICTEWRSRGYKDSLLPQFEERLTESSVTPPWLGDEDFHLSHRSNLLRKAPDHYRSLWPTDPDDLPYIWPEPSLTPTVQ